MKMDILSSDIHDNSNWLSAARCVSMMEEFITGSFAYQSYAIDQIDELSLNATERKNVNKILSNSLKSMNREYIGTDNDGKMYFVNWTT